MPTSVGITAITLPFSGMLCAQGPPVCDGEKNCNGYWWNAWGQEYKLGFVMGYRTSSLFLKASLVDQCSEVAADPAGKASCEELLVPMLSRDFFSRVTFGQLMAGIDEFYRDYRNLHIDINMAFLYVEVDIVGAHKSLLDKLLTRMRQVGGANP